MEKTSLIKARVLALFTDGEVTIQANSLVAGPSQLISSLELAGVVDPDDDAVAYVEAEGKKPIYITGESLSDAVQERIAEKVAAEPAPETPAEPATETPAEPATETPAEPAPETPAEPAPETPAEPAPTEKTGKNK